MCYEKNSHYGRQAYVMDVKGAVLLQGCIFQIDGPSVMEHFGPNILFFFLFIFLLILFLFLFLFFIFLLGR